MREIVAVVKAATIAYVAITGIGCVLIFAALVSPAAAAGVIVWILERVETGARIRERHGTQELD